MCFYTSSHLSRAWMSGSFESMWWNVCAQTRPWSILSSKRVLGNESEPMLTPREKSPVLKAQRRVEPALLHQAGQGPCAPEIPPQWSGGHLQNHRYHRASVVWWPRVHPQHHRYHRASVVWWPRVHLQNHRYQDPFLLSPGLVIPLISITVIYMASLALYGQCWYWLAQGQYNHCVRWQIWSATSTSMWSHVQLSSAFPSFISGVHHFRWDLCACDCFFLKHFLHMWLCFNSTIEVVTLRLRGCPVP